jgi:N-acyl-D-amino-acid deacylase
MIVAPGFIDAHAHDDLALLSMPDMAPKITVEQP